MVVGHVRRFGLRAIALLDPEWGESKRLSVELNGILSTLTARFIEDGRKVDAQFQKDAQVIDALKQELADANAAIAAGCHSCNERNARDRSRKPSRVKSAGGHKVRSISCAVGLKGGESFAGVKGPHCVACAQAMGAVPLPTDLKARKALHLAWVEKHRAEKPKYNIAQVASEMKSRLESPEAIIARLQSCACGHSAADHEKDALENLLQCKGGTADCKCDHFHYAPVVDLQDKLQAEKAKAAKKAA